MSWNVQINGLENVISAYVSRGVPSFAIFCGSQFLAPFVCSSINEGREKLESFLTQLLSGSNSVYTLKVYESIKTKNGSTPPTIKEKTECDGSFNFRLNDSTMTLFDGQQARISGLNEVVTRLSAIETKLNNSDNNSDQLTVLDHLKDFCDTDAGKVAVPQIVGTILNAVFGRSAAPLPQTAPRISGIENNDYQDDDQDEKLNQAINTLKQYDKKLSIHLQKLAAIALNNPGNFQMLLMMLDRM